MNWRDKFTMLDTLYENPLSNERDVQEFRLEGQAVVSFPQNRMRLENLLDPKDGQKSNYVYWCPVDFPEDIAITWDFWPIREPGLCILFFAALGLHGEDIFDTKLREREGIYEQYHHGDINAYHVSYFRRKWEEERSFHTCNLRKSFGFHLVAQGADPIPSVIDASGPYHITLIKRKQEIVFAINDLLIFDWVDDGHTFGGALGGGKIGFRQMAPMIAEYANLRVFAVK